MVALGFGLKTYFITEDSSLLDALKTEIHRLD